MEAEEMQRQLLTAAQVQHNTTYQCHNLSCIYVVSIVYFVSVVTDLMSLVYFPHHINTPSLTFTQQPAAPGSGLGEGEGGHQERTAQV
jgi:hypothetical protein